MKGYGWIITKDHNPEGKPGTNLNAAGKMGPSTITEAHAAILTAAAPLTIHPETVHSFRLDKLSAFRLYDDDGELYYDGLFLGDHESEDAFGPLEDGAHTQPAIIQSQDWYGNVSGYLVQTVKWEEGETVFVTQVIGDVATRLVLPPKVTAAIIRQRDSLSTTIRRRHGKRLAAERKAAGTLPVFTPEMRAKGLATRKAKARKRRPL